MSKEILQTLQSHGQMLVSHSEQLELIAEKVMQHNEQFDRITLILMQHDERLNHIEENMATKGDIQGITSTLDRLLFLAEKNEQEITMITHGMRRHENHIENLETDMKQVKPTLGLS